MRAAAAKCTVFIDDSADSHAALELLQKIGRECETLNVKDAPISDDRPMMLPWLIAAEGEFYGLREIRDFLMPSVK